MHPFATIVGCALILIILGDAFESIILPRRVTRQMRLARFFYRATWARWSALAQRMRGRQRDNFLGYYGPLSLLVLLATWALVLVFAFGLLHWSLGPSIAIHDGPVTFWTDLYFSGTTFFTLGLGDIAPRTPPARFLTVVEAGLGFAFLAMVIGYLPVLYQSFERREISITLLDARAGSPPSAAELLRRYSIDHGLENLGEFLKEWERWSAEVLESHLSYPVLAYFRSQHDKQSWLAAMATVLDVSALAMVGLENGPMRQARLTFAMARHALVDLAQIFQTPPRPPERQRLTTPELTQLRALLAATGSTLRDGEEADRRLTELRGMYEPFLNALSEYFLMPVPAFISGSKTLDSWQTSAWGRNASKAAEAVSAREEHF